MTQSITVERDIPHPPARLWRALTQPHLIAEWLMQNDFALALGHRSTLRGEWGGTLACEVLAIDPPTSLSYTWVHAHADPAFALTSVVTFTLTPTVTGTHLRLEQTGFRPDQRQAIAGAQLGWRKFLATLAEVAARPD